MFNELFQLGEPVAKQEKLPVNHTNAQSYFKEKREDDYGEEELEDEENLGKDDDIIDFDDLYRKSLDLHSRTG